MRPYFMHADILLATINAKWIHPSQALRLLKANLGSLEERCEIMEFALRQPLREKTDPLLAARPRIIGFSVSIWNHTATLELLKEMRQHWEEDDHPFIVLGGPEVSYLPEDAEIFRYVDYCIRGEGETAFRELCEFVINSAGNIPEPQIFHIANLNTIKSSYRLYTDEDLQKKLTYVEASRGCPYACEFCLSANSGQVREFPLEPFLAEMDELVRRGARTFKFLDRSFNINIERARRIMEFFLEKIKEQTFVVHFEMVPSRFPPELMDNIARFPPGTLRLEIGIQTLNREISARIGRPLDPERELETLRLLRQNSNAIIHADLIAGLPGEDIVSFGRGFDLMWEALSLPLAGAKAEIQLGILKLLPGAPIARHTDSFGMRYNPSPPYEVVETAAIPTRDLDRIKNFVRFWELIVNRGLMAPGCSPVFNRFMALSDLLLARFGRNWGIDKDKLIVALHEIKEDVIINDKN